MFIRDKDTNNYKIIKTSSYPEQLARYINAVAVLRVTHSLGNLTLQYIMFCNNQYSIRNNQKLQKNQGILHKKLNSGKQIIC